ncbi:hypothetical protein AVEN_148927-1 [Araneus ventricosus]|uniref:DUF4817 domain-containing protein n=1 Tax=Araneus ventricosus TaxID=182803 RepID=A0A4Y2UAS9_ARAVE|nr:hypothetical protein AVEN_148927-1 [Araneus ventricosus]
MVQLTATARLYIERYSNRRVLHHQMFRILHHNLFEYGTFCSSRHDTGRPSKRTCLRRVEEDSGTSTRPVILQQFRPGCGAQGAFTSISFALGSVIAA